METKVLFISRLSFSKEKRFLNVTPSSKVDVGAVSAGKPDSCRTAQFKRGTNRICHWKVQI